MKDIRGITSKVGAVLLGCLLLFTGCGKPKELAPANYLRWINNPDNGLVKQKEINGLIYELSYLTPEAMTLNELRSTNVDKTVFDQTRKQYGDMMYFRFKMYDKSGSHIHNYLKKKGIDPDEAEAYYNYQAEHDWQLINAQGDTVKCTLFTFAKTYGVSNEFDFEMAFTKPDAKGKIEDVTIECDDRILRNGTIKFLFSGTDINKVPQIKI